MRSYKRIPGSRNYKTSYTVDSLQLAVSDVMNKRMTLREASRRYSIPFGTLHNKVNNRHNKKTGGQTTLCEFEEQVLVENIICLAEWGFPPTLLDIRMLVCSYLERQGRTVTRWKNNIPRKDWALAFVRRHHELRQRQCQNITEKRAKVSSDDIEKYFTNLENTCENVPAENILNYDETNLSDDPGRTKCIFKRGTKYPERIMNSSKSAISLMMAGTPSGYQFPPYVVYRGQNLWSSWCTGGPKGARYNRSKSGWFDAACFEDWFRTMVVPWAKKLNGSKVVIGDNLSSHFSTEVLRLCKELDIHFVCLPPNSTHLCQPLDVAFFKPMKQAWRDILTDFKKKDGHRLTTLPKDRFPTLLKQLCVNIEKNAANNIKAGFRKCGIFPLDKAQVLNRLPVPTQTEPNTVVSNVSDAVVETLNELRSARSPPLTTTRRKRQTVEPGKSITEEDINVSIGGGPSVNPSTSNRKRCRKDDAEDEDTSSLNSSCLDDTSSDGSSTSTSSQQSADNLDHAEAEGTMANDAVSTDAWVVVKFLSKKTVKFYIGQITKINEDDTINVMFTRKCMDAFIWPNVEDHSEVERKDIVAVLDDPVTDRRGRMTFFIPPVFKGKLE